MGKLDALVEEGEVAIKRIQDYIGDVALEKSEFTEKTLLAFREAKQELLTARHELFSLAQQTKAKGKRIEIMINNWDGQSKAVLKRSLRTFSVLLSITLTKLEAAKKTYYNAINKFDETEVEGLKFKNHLKDMLDTESAAYKKWTTEVRAASYTTAGAVTAGMIVADVFGCLGFCSGLVTTSVWGTTIGTVESTIAEYSANIESLKELTGNFINSLADLDELTDGTVELLKNEVLIIIEWEENARDTEEIIDEFTEEEIEEYNGYQPEIRSAMTGLMDAVEKFLDQPKNIFNEG